MTEDLRAAWDRAAAHFDQQPDHGLEDPSVRRAWEELLLPLLPRPDQVVADLGCGTGSLSLLLARAGHLVHGVDFSAAMLDVARAKASAAGVPVTFTEADAAQPPLRPGTFDVVVARHVLWALPDPAAALSAWLRLLRPTGQLILIEGRWSTGVGLTAAACSQLVLGSRREAQVRPLADATLWGGPVDDERYLLTSRR